MPSDTRSNGTAQHNEAPSAPAMLVRSAQPGDASDPEVSIDLAYAPYSGTESSTIRIPHDWSGLRDGVDPPAWTPQRKVGRGSRWQRRRSGTHRRLSARRWISYVADG